MASDLKKVYQRRLYRVFQATGKSDPETVVTILKNARVLEASGRTEEEVKHMMSGQPTVSKNLFMHHFDHYDYDTLDDKAKMALMGGGGGADGGGGGPDVGGGAPLDYTHTLNMAEPHGLSQQNRLQEYDDYDYSDSDGEADDEDDFGKVGSMEDSYSDHSYNSLGSDDGGADFDYDY